MPSTERYLREKQNAKNKVLKYTRANNMVRQNYDAGKYYQIALRLQITKK